MSEQMRLGEGHGSASRPRLTHKLALWVSLLLSASGCGSNQEPSAAADAGDGFVPYFDGESVEGFEFVGITQDDVSVEDGVLKCKCQPNGYMYKNESFRNFVMKLEFRFERPAGLAPGADSTFTGNSGYFVYLTPPHEIWPRCLEVQGSYQESGDIFGLPGLLPGADDPDMAKIAAQRRPVGEWNTLSISSQEGALEIDLNGVVVNTSAAGELVEGLIALESEGAEIHWRNVMIQKKP